MKLDMLRRFAFVETQVLWGGGITAGELARNFGITRQAAQATLNRYRAAQPGNLAFDPRRKCHVGKPGFDPAYIRPGVNAFLDYLRGQSLVEHYAQDAEWSDLPFTDVDRLVRPTLDDESVREVLAALYRQNVVSIEYLSKTRRLVRDLSPHRLVFASNRYHVRGYCHVSSEFRDFVLSRIIRANPSRTDWVSDKEDVDWHATVELQVMPNPALPESTQTALAEDHGAVPGRPWRVRCRKALVGYVEQTLGQTIGESLLPKWLVCRV